MATTRFAATEWHGPLTEGSGTVTLESSGLGSFDVTWASRTEDPNGAHEPRGADRCRPLVVLLDGAVERAGQGRHPAHDAAHSSRGRLPAGRGHHGVRLHVVGDVPGLDADGFREAAEGARQNCPVSMALAAVPISLTVG